MTKKKWVVVCPECHEVSKGKGWIATFDSVEEAHVKLTEDGDWDITKSEVTDRELYKVTHKCGFESTEWDVSDFAIALERNKIVAKGGYWETFKDKLEEVAKEKGWEYEGGENDGCN